MNGASEVSLVALGGLGEFGRNVLWLSGGGSNLLLGRTGAAGGVSGPQHADRRGNRRVLRAEVALAVKRSCRREFGIRPEIVPVIV